MAFSPASFIHGTALRFHCRLILNPWVKRKNSIICCAQGRAYSSSLPVKYIPKKSLINVEDETSYLPVEQTPKNEVKEVNSFPVRDWGTMHNLPELNVPRVDVPENSSSSSCDVESKSHGVSHINNELNLDVKERIVGNLVAVKEEITEKPEEMAKDNGKRLRGIQSAHCRQEVEKLAIKLLASRAYTALELKKKLQGKRCPADIVDIVVTDFQTRGLVDDSLYAETYSRSRWSSSSWGPRRIRNALFKKGVREADADKAIKQIFENDEECGRSTPEMAMSKLSIDQLYVKAAKQWQQSRGVPHETRKSRIVRWLQYRGFNWSVIKYVLKKLESESS